MLICNETVIDAPDVDVKIVENIVNKGFEEPDVEMINDALAKHNGVVSSAAKTAWLEPLSIVSSYEEV